VPLESAAKHLSEGGLMIRIERVFDETHVCIRVSASIALSARPVKDSLRAEVVTLHHASFCYAIVKNRCSHAAEPNFIV
jgi:hypothetical protein